MSDKLTPELLSRFKLEAARNSNLLAGELFIHIAAVEAERDALVALIREYVELPLVGDRMLALRNRARQALAAMETKP